MGFGDKLKGLRDQAQQAVAENKDKIQGAVQSAAEVANARTGGKYADKISTVGEKLNANLEKIADDPGASGATVTEEPAAATAATGESTVAEEAAPVVDKAPPVAPTSAPPEFE